MRMHTTRFAKKRGRILIARILPKLEAKVLSEVLIVRHNDNGPKELHFESLLGRPYL